MTQRMSFRDTIPQRTCCSVYTDYRKYKPALVKDFSGKCGYCDAPHFWLGGKRTFHIDHFAPHSKFPELKTTYSNLVYSCPFCNMSKSDDWPSDSPAISISDDKGYIDPCNTAYDELFYRDSEGNIHTESALGEYIYERLNFSLSRHRIIWSLQKLWSIKQEIAKLLSKPHLCDGNLDCLKDQYINISLKFDEYFGDLMGDL